MEETKKKLVVILSISVLIFGYSLYDYNDKTEVEDEPKITIQDSGAETLAEPEYIIYVSGAVNKPGVFKITPESRIFDAINSAGGLTARADVEKINMAQIVKDGMHIQVPTKVKPLPSTTLAEGINTATGTGSGGNSSITLISINTASKSDLEKIPGIGPALAQRIIDYRSSNGPFLEIEDIRKVAGIGQVKFNQMKDKISL